MHNVFQNEWLIYCIIFCSFQNMAQWLAAFAGSVDTENNAYIPYI